MIKQKHFYLIRGLVREARHWDDFPEHLLRHFPGAKITMIDIPGAGEYYDSPTPLSVKGMTEVMHRKFLDSREEGEEAVMIAISLGGMIAGHWLKARPGDFQQAVLINTSFGGLSLPFERLRPSAFLYLLASSFSKGRDKEERILRLVSNNPARHGRTIELWARINEEKPVKGGTALRQLLAAAFYRADAAPPQVPICLLSSTHDRMVNVNCSRAIARAWNVPLIEHPTGGHDITTDHPEWVAREVQAFLSSSAPALSSQV